MPRGEPPAVSIELEVIGVVVEADVVQGLHPLDVVVEADGEDAEPDPPLGTPREQLACTRIERDASEKFVDRFCGEVEAVEEVVAEDVEAVEEVVEEAEAVEEVAEEVAKKPAKKPAKKAVKKTTKKPAKKEKKED